MDHLPQKIKQLIHHFLEYLHFYKIVFYADRWI